MEEQFMTKRLAAISTKVRNLELLYQSNNLLWYVFAWEETLKKSKKSDPGFSWCIDYGRGFQQWDRGRKCLHWILCFNGVYERWQHHPFIKRQLHRMETSTCSKKTLQGVISFQKITIFLSQFIPPKWIWNGIFPKELSDDTNEFLNSFRDFG